ncbi:MAG: hypothetical protein ACRDSK_09735 [Actinophytocola sp.]
MPFVVRLVGEYVVEILATRAHSSATPCVPQGSGLGNACSNIAVPSI